MLQYIVSVGISVLIFIAIQYYFNNYSSAEHKEFFNNGYNKYYIFVALLIIINSIMYLYFNNSFMDIINKSARDLSAIGGSNTEEVTNLKTFENEFINNIKNQEVDVGLAPF